MKERLKKVLGFLKRAILLTLKIGVVLALMIAIMEGIMYLFGATTWEDRAEDVGEYTYSQSLYLVSEKDPIAVAEALEDGGIQKIAPAVKQCIGDYIIKYIAKEAPLCQAPPRILGVGSRLDNCMQLSLPENKDSLVALYLTCSRVSAIVEELSE